MTSRAARAMLETTTEAQWQAMVIDYARVRKWHVVHHRISRGTEAGWPDLFCLRPPRAVVLELKRERGRVSPAQARTLDLLRGCGIDARVVRPSDWDEVCSLLW